MEEVYSDIQVQQATKNPRCYPKMSRERHQANQFQVILADVQTNESMYQIQN